MFERVNLGVFIGFETCFVDLFAISCVSFTHFLLTLSIGSFHYFLAVGAESVYRLHTISKPMKKMKRLPHAKAGYKTSVRINLSLPPSLDERKEEICRKYAMPTFSDYVQARMRKDLGIELAA